jgi:predicted DNA-binding ribbon-helix-helix protein
VQPPHGDSQGTARPPAAISGHRTSISLEAAFWDALKAAAAEDGVPVARLIAQIDAERSGCGLSSAIRVWLLARFRGDA